MKPILKTLLFAAFLVVFTSHIYAITEGQIVGRIMLKDSSDAVAYAEVIFENNMDKIVVSANEYGYYYANHIPTGRYDMTVVFNNRHFVMKHVRVYDSNSTEINFYVSKSNDLPPTVEVQKQDILISSVETPNSPIIASNGQNQASQSLSDILSSQPGVDIVGGKLYIKGSDQVKFFVDGEPVMGPAVIQSSW